MNNELEKSKHEKLEEFIKVLEEDDDYLWITKDLPERVNIELSFFWKAIVLK